MNVKSGDLAYVVWSRIEENIGKVVEVKAISASHSAHYGVPIWAVRASSPSRTENGKVLRDAWIRDSQLRPISGVPIEDEITEDLREPA